MIVKGKNTIPNMASIISISILTVFDWLNKKKEFKKSKYRSILPQFIHFLNRRVGPRKPKITAIIGDKNICHISFLKQLKLNISRYFILQ